MTTQTREQIIARVARCLKDHQYTQVAKAVGVEVWRCMEPKSNAYAFDIAMSRYGIAVYGDIGTITFDVGISYGMAFLAGDDDETQYSKLDAAFRATELDRERLGVVVFEAIIDLLSNRDVELPDFAKEPVPNYEALIEWLLTHTDGQEQDGDYAALTVAMRDAVHLRFDSQTLDGACQWLSDHEDILELASDDGYNLDKPSDSVMRRIYMARHAAKQILAQKAAQPEPEPLYAVREENTGIVTAFATHEFAKQHAAMVNIMHVGAVGHRNAQVIPSPWDAVEHWMEVAARQQSLIKDMRTQSTEQLMGMGKEVAKLQIELMSARGFIVARHAFENDQEAIETVAGIDKVLASARTLELMAKSESVEYAYAMDHSADDWSNDSLASFVSDHELIAGAVIHRGEVSKSTASSFLPDIGDVVNHMANQASDASEFADHFPDLTDEQQAELDTLMEPMRAWVDKNCEVRFYEVSKIEPYSVTEADVAAGVAYREALEAKAVAQ